ncbi:MAG: glycosyltransferase family 9 protein [Planctomycetaceae bacterium]|nr:glycosyltransferase family 9 protein [Planctomycetaceae bacterium]
MPVFTGLDPRRICIIKPSALGDVVQSLPLLDPLRARFPKASVSWVIGKGLGSLLEGHAGIDELIEFDRKGGVRGLVSLLRTLRSRKFDVVFDLQGLFRTGLMTWSTAAPVRIGLHTSREGAHRSYTSVVDGTGRDVPARLRCGRVIDEITRDETVVGTAPKRPLENSRSSASESSGLPLTIADRAFATQRLKSLTQPVLAICPGARWATKRWPARNFAALAARAHRQFGAAAMILGGPDEQKLGQRVEHHLRELMPSSAIVNLVGGTTLRQLAAVLEGSTWVAANDSGPMHLADAVGTPVLGLFTCTSPWLSGPPLDRHELISTRMLCAASYHKSCPFSGAKHHACLGELGVDRAWVGFVRLVAKSRRQAA